MKRILLVGAGASHGHGLNGRLKPPLMSKFFNQEIKSNLNQIYQLLFKYIQNLVAENDLA